MNEPKKKLFPVCINEQIPYAFWIDEEDDPWVSLEKKCSEVMSYFTKVHRAVKNTLRNFLFRESRPLLPPSPLECKLTANDAHCLVCGDEFGNEFAQCSGCNTPYHHDCWKYIGKCSIYGCKTKVSTPNTYK